MNKEQFLIILTNYLEGKATKEEINFMHDYYNLFMSDYDVISLLKDKESDKLKLSIKLEIDKHIDQGSRQFKKLSIWPRIAAAAAIILTIGGGALYYNRKIGVDHAASYSSKNNINPGSNKAILTLANGKKISLTDAINGIIVQQSGIKVTKSKKGQLIYVVSSPPDSPNDGKNEKTIGWNTISTPRGGQWQVILPDGSKVWLNAASTLKYPERFTGKERKVELQGEAYFEVVHNVNRPFKVSSTGQMVEVLGTHFNINAYSDEAIVKTTLLEGSVKIWELEKNNAQLLKPDQEAVISAAGIKITNVDAEDAISWKEGIFLFNDDHLDAIMKRISRWYDVDVEFKDEVLKKEMYSGTVSRFAQVSQVLKKLEALGGVSFRIEPHKIIVMRK
jgi:hypothetical protein